MSAIKGFRSMLSRVFRHKNLDITSDKDLAEIVRSFEIKVPKRGITTPHWDLDIVLKALTMPPYEPLGEASFRDLSKKVLFLTALATAKRVGELQAVAVGVGFKKGDAVLQYLPEFLAKTESASNPLPRHFTLKHLTSLVGRGEEERLLCPVRALKYYLKETEKIRPRPRSLFLGCANRLKPISKNAISYLIRETIREAHRSQPEREYHRDEIRAHSIRGIATSLHFMKNKSLSSVLEAATWKGNSIFVSHYLKDVQTTYGHCSALGPIIAVGIQV